MTQTEKELIERVVAMERVIDAFLRVPLIGGAASFAPLLKERGLRWDEDLHKVVALDEARKPA